MEEIDKSTIKCKVEVSELQKQMGIITDNSYYYNLSNNVNYAEYKLYYNKTANNPYYFSSVIFSDSFKTYDEAVKYLIENKDFCKAID